MVVAAARWRSAQHALDELGDRIALLPRAQGNRPNAPRDFRQFLKPIDAATNLVEES